VNDFRQASLRFRHARCRPTLYEFRQPVQRFGKSVRHGREAESEMRGRIEAAPGCEQDAVIEGRKAVLKEIAESAQTLRDYLTEAARTLLAESRFLDVLPGFVLDNERVPLIQERLAVIAAGVS
jgi:hypothetical protein